ncbi:hypothetical protein [Pseudomonas aeruginosa]|uniref:hypothetical protein n=1 Tax=Pseudomonas aeruginosa TaxID=287 RepID=UPI00128FC0DB|nr:hypothetical protein [Pseudomonas aeruginosa]
MHDLASDFSCADSSWKKRHKDVPEASGSVPRQCRSKTLLSRKIEQKERISAVASQRKTSQAQARCGVSVRKSNIRGEAATIKT